MEDKQYKSAKKTKRRNTLRNRKPFFTILLTIYQDAAIYFDPKKPTDIADKIINLLKSPKAKDDLVKKGYLQVKKYSWQKWPKKP